jgi:formylglycine-generating enzyme required for sulfatase activity
VSVVSATTVTAVTPAGTAGAKTVSLTTPGGTANLTNGFTYVAAPTVTSINPNSGATTGGAAVTITGTGFTGATGVSIGGVAATSVVVVNATTITANAPALAAGVYAVSVTTPFGTGTLANAYTAVVYPPPTISSVSPNVGPTAGGTAITITGNNFTGATSVTIGGVAATNLVVASTTSITATTPAGTAGAKNVVVTSPWGQGTLTNGFTYFAAPSISSVSPNQGPTAGGTAITITGTNLTGTTSVTVGGAAATSVSVVSATTVTAVTPAGTAGAKTVSLTTPGGTANLSNGFTYGLGPSISSVSPNVGPTAGGTAITITGTNLTGTSSVTVGGNPATSVSVVSATTVTAVTPAGTAGAANVSLTTPYGSTTANGAFTYQLYGTPTISSVLPSGGPLAGGTAITITGTNLTGASSVTIGGVAATSVSVVSATTVTAVTPAGTAGAKTVSVTTPGGTANLTNGFTYTSVWYTVLEQNPDPAIVTSATLRNAITATGYPWRVRDNGTNIEMVLIPPGTFNMGCSASNAYGCGSDESPVHSVTLTNAFYLGRYEVTQAQWQARMGSNPSYFQSASAQVPVSQVPNRPVEQLSWNAVQGFLASTNLRLPTEAEWEYACRAGTTTAFHGFAGLLNGTSDDAQVANIAWITSNATSQTRPVGGKAANGFGLHDMSGNVWELVNDWYGSTYYSTSATTNPQGPASGIERSMRGGSILDTSSLVRSSVRGYFAPTSTGNNVGFRVARAPQSPPTISGIAPGSGSTAGGTVITITGTNLTGASSVTIGGVSATSVSVVSATTVTAVTPAGTAGAKTVSVTTPDGTANLANGFTYTSVWYTVLEQNPDPAIVTSATLRNAITATGYPWRVRDNVTQIEMVLIPPGTFNMGCTASNVYSCDTDESPVHVVTLTNAFYLGRYEVTQAQWTARMGSNPSSFQSASTAVPAAQVPNRPVEQVSWNTIQNFLTATGMRLPTEAEWEYACRAGTTTAFHGFTGYLNGTNDDTLVGNIAWYDSNSSSQTRPVGGKAANGFGLHDMAGNVWEWVNDWYSSSFYASSPSTNPSGPTTGTLRGARGGSWGFVSGGYLRSCNRYFLSPEYSANNYGFRVARAPQ